MGGGLAARRGGVADDPAHDALPRGGRPARRPPRHRLAREDRGRRHARGAEGEPPRRRGPGRAHERQARRGEGHPDRHRGHAGDRARRAHDRRACARRRARHCRESSARSTQPGSASPPSPSRDRRSTTCTCTSPDATSPRRTAANDDRPPHLVHDLATGAQPDARADLDRAAARAADGLARALRPALPQRDAPRRLRHDVVHHVSRAGDRRDERVLRRDVERHVDDRRPRPQGRRALPRDPRLALLDSFSRRSSALR